MCNVAHISEDKGVVLEREIIRNKGNFCKGNGFNEKIGGIERYKNVSRSTVISGHMSALIHLSLAQENVRLCEGLVDDNGVAEV